jgi:hypothetical protein
MYNCKHLLVGMILSVQHTEARLDINILLHVMRRKIMKCKITNSTGKFPVSCSSFQFVLLADYIIVFFFFCFFLFSGPAHILCLSVASGCNKERCIAELSSLLINMKDPLFG